MRHEVKLLLLATALAWPGSVWAADEPAPAAPIPSQAPATLPAMPALEPEPARLPVPGESPSLFSPKANETPPKLPTTLQPHKRIPTQEEIDARKREENWVLEALKNRTADDKDKNANQAKDPYREEVERQLHLQKFGDQSGTPSLSNSSGTLGSKPGGGFMKIQPLQPSITANAMGGPQNYSAVSSNHMDAAAPFNPGGTASTPQLSNPIVTPPSAPLQPILGPQPSSGASKGGTVTTFRQGNIMLDPLPPGGVRKISSNPNFTPATTVKIPVFNAGSEPLKTGGISPPPSGLNSGISRQQLNLDAAPERRPTPIDIHNTIPEPTAYNRFK
jgi:hypothetical protein